MHKLFICIAICIIVYSCSDPTAKTDSDRLSSSRVIVPEGYSDLTGVHDMKTILCQCWDNSEDLEDLKGQSESYLELVLRGYCFFKDGSVLKDPRGAVRIGTWRLNDKQNPILIEIEFPDKNEEFKLGSLTPFTLKFAGAYKPVSDYTGAGLVPNDISANPFHPDNNTWRIRPRISETQMQIKARLKSSIHFYILFYEHMIKGDFAKVSFAGLPTCFKWYAGGIYLQPEEKLSESWVSCFYNREQAMTAYSLAEKLLSKKYTWPKNESNWLKLNLAVLKQLLEQIDSVN